MPIQSNQLTAHARLQALVLGAPFMGKTRNVLLTCEKPAYVIACDGAPNLVSATSAGAADFVYDEVTATDMTVVNQMNAAITEAMRGARAGEYKTIVLDTISSYAERVGFLYVPPDKAGDKGEQIGAGWRQLDQALANTIERLKNVPAHLIVLAHYVELHGKPLPGQANHFGEGIIPLLPGKAKETFSKRFNCVVMIEREKPDSENRVFTTAPTGVFLKGLGFRGGKGGIVQIPADVRLLWEKLQELKG